MSSYRPKRKKLPSAKGLRFAIVASRYNEPITLRLLKGARQALWTSGVKQVDEVWVPGAFELPLALQRLAEKKRYHGLIALGAVIRGETPHFEFVAQGAAHGIMEVMLKARIPIAFGLLTTENERQARERSGGRLGNKGEEAAWVAIEMANRRR